MSNVLVCEQQVTCKADIVSLWNIITDTDRLNRAMGSDAVKYENKDDASAARFIATTKLGGFAVRYDERPYEWSYLERCRVLRRMQSGPIMSLDIEFLFAAQPNTATLVTLRLTAVLRHAWLKPVVRFQLGRSVKKCAKEVQLVDRAIVSGAGAPPTRRGRVNHDLMSGLGSLLHQQGELAELTDKLLSYVMTASDYDVARIRPFVLADEWKADRAAVLSVFLGAAQVGLLDLQWELICPSCRSAAQTLDSLDGIGQHGRCQLCEIKFGVDLDEALEATFRVPKKLRDVDTGIYCIAGPARMRHVLGQVVLGRHDLSLLIVPPDQGRYRLFVRGGATAAIQVQNGAAKLLDVELAELHAQSQIILAPSGMLRIHNGSDRDLHAKVEVVEWVRQAATAAQVITSPRFARDFAHAKMPAGQPLMLHNVGIVSLRWRSEDAFVGMLGEETARGLVGTWVKRLAAVFERFGGGVAESGEHGMLVTFGNPLDATAAMRNVHKEFERVRMQNPAVATLQVVMGFAAGEMELSSDDGIKRAYTGPAVDKARALAEHAHAGGSLVENQEVQRAVMAGRLSDAELGEAASVLVTSGPLATRHVAFAR